VGTGNAIIVVVVKVLRNGSSLRDADTDAADGPHGLSMQ